MEKSFKMNYNYIAPYYDRLSRISFLNRQQKAHELILNYLKPNDKVLWLGGGSGWFLKDLEGLTINISIDYIELSEVMIQKAKSIPLNHLEVKFYQEDFFQFNPKQTYDVILTAFVFDHFSEEDCQVLFNRYEPFLRKGGKWIQIDFSEDQNFFQRFLTKSMVLFFKLVAGIQTKDFPKINHLFARMQLIESRTYFMNYIVSRVYQK